MRPQRLDIGDLELGALHEALNVADGIELSVRKHVAVDEFGGHRRFPPFRVVRDAVIEEQTPGFEQAVHGRKIHRQILQSDMLKHTHAGHLVVNRFSGQIPIVQQFNAHPLRQAGLLDSLAGHLQLLGTQGNAMGAHPMVLRCINDQRTPPAANIQKILSWLQRQFAAYVLELCLLGCIQVDFRGLEIRAGIHHRAIQP